MKRIFHSIDKWEDKKNGMYNHLPLDNELIKKCVYLLTNDILFFQIMKQVCKEWKNAAESNLSHINNNRRAWLGRASCCYYINAPENITQHAWISMTDKQRENANKTADKFLIYWYEKYEKQLNLFEVTNA